MNPWIGPVEFEMGAVAAVDVAAKRTTWIIRRSNIFTVKKVMGDEYDGRFQLSEQEGQGLLIVLESRQSTYTLQTSIASLDKKPQQLRNKRVELGLELYQAKLLWKLWSCASKIRAICPKDAQRLPTQDPFMAPHSS